MNYALQIIETFKASTVRRILVVDDAFDPPEFDPQLSGDLLDVLTAIDLRKHVSEGRLGDGDRDAAVAALKESEFDAAAITNAMAALYLVFYETRAASIDPGGAFTAAKGTALDGLGPLLELLRCCGAEAQIRTVGVGDAAITVYLNLQPDLIFMDFYLSPPSRAAKDITKGQQNGDRDRSIKLLKQMLAKDVGADPAVVLISSQDVGDRKKAYLGRLDNRVMALRFGYLYKGWVEGAGQSLTASGEAADVLIHTSGSFEFGRTLEEALKIWQTGAEKALKDLCGELRDFDIKDFAYLLRLRLYDEGQPFADYLEWFLGESLRAIVDERVAWTTDHFARLDDKELTDMIEGAHPVPSMQIAKFFHRMRFNSWEIRPRIRFALGDLFLAPSDKKVRMVILPDCDLVPRKEKAAASRILTIGGEIRALHEDHTSAGDLIFHNDVPKTIRWNLKDLMTHEFGDRSKLEVDGTAYEFLASMRPISAQGVQKMALADLSRVGIAVPPTVSVSAPVKVYLKKLAHNQVEVVELETLREAWAQVFMPRGGNDMQKRALFTQTFVRDLLARLEGMKVDDVHPDHREYWKGCIEKAEKLSKDMLREGLVLPGEAICKIAVSIGKPKSKTWLEIVINVSDEALIDSHGTDALALIGLP